MALHLHDMASSSRKRRRSSGEQGGDTDSHSKRPTRRRGSSELYDSPSPAPRPPPREPWAEAARERLALLQHVLSDREVRTGHVACEVGPKVLMLAMQTLRNAFRLYVEDKTTLAGDFKADRRLIDGVLWLANMLRPETVPEFRIPKVRVAGPMTPPADPPPPAPQRSAQVQHDAASLRDGSVEAELPATPASIGRPQDATPPPALKKAIEAASSRRTKVWARIIKCVDFDIAEEHIQLLGYQSALFFADKELLPSRSRNVADMFVYANRLTTRSMQDSLRSAILAYAFFLTSLAYLPYPSTHCINRIRRWEDKDYANFFALHNIEGDFTSNKELCVRQRSLGHKLWLFAQELGVGILPVVLRHATIEELVDAPATLRHEAIQHLRTLKVNQTPVVVSLNDRITRLVEYLMGAD